MDFELTIREAWELLDKNKVEWEGRYAAYAESIAANVGFIEKNRARFHEWSPLRLYLNTTNAKSAKTTASFDLRYLGQNVASMLCTPEDITISTVEYDDKNLRDFNCEIKLPGDIWTSEKASEFRSFFSRKTQTTNPGNEEHRLESLLLSEFSKKKSEGKALLGIQPVMIAGVRFPMPTPLTASKRGELKYSGANGGCIDILTRTGIGNATRLCIMELKDEYKEPELPPVVLQQAVKYTVFIRELLRSKAGEGWYKLLGFGSQIPQKLILNAACVMPMPDTGDADTSFEGSEYNIKDGDKIHLHYVYFKERGNKIEAVRTSL